ncbi:MAG: dihydrolipoamide acetyltransferase family protein [Anaerolineales bacterium]|jgi:pyruvate dehydrogenase E2 component (dihydrolipoamide acetyltransferase)
MAEKITMPKLGFDMAEGTLVRWVIQEGGEVNKGAILAEIETDKATVEVESTHSGVLHKHLVNEGDIVPVGDPIAIVGEAGEEIPDELLAEEAEAEQEAQPSEEQVEPVEEKVTPPAGEAEPERDQPAEEAVEGQLPGGLRASPVARRMAEEHDLDLSKIEGSGPSGRIVKKDVEAWLAKPAKPEAPAGEEPVAEAKPAEAKAPALMPALAPVGPPPPDEEVPLTRLRSIIARRMTEARQRVPHFYVTHEYDMAPLLELRAQVNQLLPKEEKISVNDFIVKATALALRQFPNLNASFAEDKIVRHGQVNVGVAVAVPDGLLTVVCQDTDRKPVRQIAVEVASMVNRAREGRVKNDDIQGSTFSVSNMGMFDVDHFIAIINPPEAAILAVGSAKEVPVVVNGELTVGTRMKATLSVDHRVSDGVEAARFMQALADYLEEPMRLLL